MPRKTDGEKIDELEKLVAGLIERVEAMSETLTAMGDHTNRIVLIEYQLAELKKGQEKWGQRLWMLLAPLVGAVIGSLLTYYLKK